MRMLFLGAGSGRECFDAYNLVKNVHSNACIHTAALTPIAPDIAPLMDEDAPLERDVFIQKQFIDDFADIDLSTELPFDLTYDQYGPLFHTEWDDSRYLRMLEKAYRSTSSFGFLVQEHLRHQQAIWWGSRMSNDDVLVCNNYASVLIRDARLLLTQCLQNTYHIEDSGNKRNDQNQLEQTLTSVLDSLTQAMNG